MVTVVCQLRPTRVRWTAFAIKIAALGNPAGVRHAAGARRRGHNPFCQPRGCGAAREAPDPEDTHARSSRFQATADRSIGHRRFAAHAGPLLGAHHLRGGVRLPAGAKTCRHFMRKHAVEDIAIFRQQCRPGVFRHAGAVGRAYSRRSQTRRRGPDDSGRPAEARPATRGHACSPKCAGESSKIAGKSAWAFEPAENLLESREGSVWQAALTTLKAPTMAAAVVALVLACWWITYRFVFDLMRRAFSAI